MSSRNVVEQLRMFHHKGFLFDGPMGGSREHPGYYGIGQGPMQLVAIDRLNSQVVDYFSARESTFKTPTKQGHEGITCVFPTLFLV